MSLKLGSPKHQFLGVQTQAKLRDQHVYCDLRHRIAESKVGNNEWIWHFLEGVVNFAIFLNNIFGRAGFFAR
jgi:hypothetical protein